MITFIQSQNWSVLMLLGVFLIVATLSFLGLSHRHKELYLAIHDIMKGPIIFAGVLVVIGVCFEYLKSIFLPLLR